MAQEREGRKNQNPWKLQGMGALKVNLATESGDYPGNEGNERVMVFAVGFTMTEFLPALDESDHTALEARGTPRAQCWDGCQDSKH